MFGHQWPIKSFVLLGGGLTLLHLCMVGSHLVLTCAVEERPNVDACIAKSGGFWFSEPGNVGNERVHLDG